MADGEGPGGERAVGDTVEALHEDGEWYTATVKKVREDGTFDVVWEDGGEKRKKVPPDEIRDPASKKSPKKKKAPPPEVDAPPAAEEPPPQEQPAAQPPAAQPPAGSSSGRKSPRAAAERSPRAAAAAAAQAAKTPAQVQADVSAAHAELRKLPGRREVRCARWTVEERLGVKFADPDHLQILWVSDGAAERFLERDVIGMLLTHIDGIVVNTVSDVRCAMGDKLTFRWILAPGTRKLPVYDPQKDVLVEKVTIPEAKEVGGKTFFLCRVVVAIQPGHLGPQKKYDVERRYSHFDELRKALAKAGWEEKEKAFPEKTLTKCSGAQLDARRKALEAWLGCAVKAQYERPAVLRELNSWFDAGAERQSPPQSPT